MCARDGAEGAFVFHARDGAEGAFVFLVPLCQLELTTFALIVMSRWTRIWH
jgi:hypothetical protein